MAINNNSSTSIPVSKHRIIPEPTTKDIERFCSHVDIKGPNDCWEWHGFIDPTGYGHTNIGKVKCRAHRVAYTIAYGNIPDGLIICHKCDNRKCVNPFHLYAGTFSDNVQDIIKRNRKSPYKRSGFWEKVDIKEPDQCWEWLGSRQNGYGSNSYGKYGNSNAHRKSYELTYGEIPIGIIVRHKCDYKPCVNPNHLELGTQLDNAQDIFRNTENNKTFKLNSDQVAEIRKLKHEGMSDRDLAKKYNLNRGSVNCIVTGKIWKNAESKYIKPIEQQHQSIPFETIQEIRGLYESGTITSQKELCEIYKISPGHISLILNYKTRKYS